MFLLPYPKQVRDHVAEVTAEIRLAGLETPRPPARGVKAAEIALVLAQKGPLPPKMLALAVDIVTPGRAIGENQSGQIRLLAFVAAMKAAGLVRIVEVRPARGRATQARLWISLTQAGLAFAAEARQKELELDAKFPITLRPKQETTNDYDPSPIRRIRIRGLSVIRTVGRS